MEREKGDDDTVWKTFFTLGLYISASGGDDTLSTTLTARLIKNGR